MDVDKLGNYFEKLWQNFNRAFVPYERCDSIYSIDFSVLKNKGLNAIILDLDDTLIAKTSLDVTPKLYAFIEDLKSRGFKICISSNNRHPKRVEFIAKTLALPFISLAFKPLPFPFEKALLQLGAQKNETAIIGDQLFTDILGGNLFGIYTILVTPLSGETSLVRQWMRQAEKFFLR